MVRVDNFGYGRAFEVPAGTFPDPRRLSAHASSPPSTMKWTVLSLLLPVLATGQTITYQWLNEPSCASVLSCDTGCTACNSAVNSLGQFTGTDVAFLGVDVCPHPFTVADNTLFTYGWPAIPDEGHAVLVTGIAFSPVRIDSLVIRHRSAPDGPQRLRVRFGVNVTMPGQELADVAAPTEFVNTVATGLGTVEAAPEMVYGFFSLVLQPYMGAGGPWELDGIRIAGTAVPVTGIEEIAGRVRTGRAQRFDAAGRTEATRPDQLFYIDGTRRVVLR